MIFSRSFQSFSFLCSAVLLLAARDAYAHPQQVSPEPLASEFDLARHGEDSGSDRRHRLGEVSQAYPKDKLGPRWRSENAGGLTFEAGALGAGRKGMPRLAHIGVYSSF